MGARTIAIPDFKNNTPRYQAEQFVTGAVREEFIRRSHLLLVVDVSRADLVLEGQIVNFTVTPLSYADRASANLYELRIEISVRLIDSKTKGLVFEGSNLVFRDTYETDLADFFSQETESLNQIAVKFAASIVSAILENF